MAPQRLQVPVHGRLVVAVVGAAQPVSVCDRAPFAASEIAGGATLAPFPSRSQIAPFAAAASFSCWPQVAAASFAARLQPIAGRSAVASARSAFPPRQAPLAAATQSLRLRTPVGVGQLDQQLLGRLLLGVLAEESQTSSVEVPLVLGASLPRQDSDEDDVADVEIESPSEATIAVPVSTEKDAETDDAAARPQAPETELIGQADGSEEATTASQAEGTDRRGD
jgi:hypothetical protein